VDLAIRGVALARGWKSEALDGNTMDYEIQRFAWANEDLRLQNRNLIATKEV
jgi:hypothetical protein